MMKYEKAILEHLLDKYERSKSFTGDNRIVQNFSVKLAKLFPKYGDEAEYDLFCSLNETVSELENMKYITSKKMKNGIIDTVTLNVQFLDEIYRYISRTPKAQTNEQLISLLDTYSDKNDLLKRFCDAQKIRLSQNKKAEYFDGDVTEYEKLLKAVAKIFDVSEETFIRDYSIKVFGDSKTFEYIKSKVKRLLFQYGDFPDEDTILEDLNIIKNPGHVYVKGNAVIVIKGQRLDLSELNGDIAISSALLPEINSITVTGRRVMTIENLTTFNAFHESDTFAVYLGGYHNSHRRNFIKKIYHDNPDAEYYHFGDIDAGGFYILLHLRAKTGVRFMPYHMGISELQQFKAYTKPLTDNDKKRLDILNCSEFSDTVNYMVEHDCKLEQEAVDLILAQ